MAYKTKCKRCIAMLGFMSAIFLILLTNQGCKDKKSAEKDKKSAEAEDYDPTPRDPLRGRIWERTSCADGTIYIVNSTGLFWLTEGKAYGVRCEDRFFGSRADLFADAKGGVYAKGRKHLWYVRAGKATRVEEAGVGKALPEAKAPTSTTVMWSVLSAYGEAAYTAGRDDGWDAGRESVFNEHIEK